MEMFFLLFVCYLRFWYVSNATNTSLLFYPHCNYLCISQVLLSVRSSVVL